METSSEFISDQVTAIRVQKGIDVDNLPSNILYNSGAKKNQYNKTGARTVANILVRAGLIKEENDTYQVVKKSETVKQTDEKQEGPSDSEGEEEQSGTATRETKAGEFELAVNLQLQLPEFEDTDKYEDLFRALRRHLLEPVDDE